MVDMASKVYDLLYPSPIPLKELSAIAVAIELWRLDVNQYIKSVDFEEDVDCEHFEQEPKLTLRDVIPYIPTVIDGRMTGYIKKLRASTIDWLRYSYARIFRFYRHNSNAILTIDWLRYSSARIFRFYRHNSNAILKDFDDIVCDHDGTIHYVRTAKRMMLCDRISQHEKFKIACEYSFEADIRRIWPSVQSKVNLDEIDFHRCPILYYWVCFLRNEIDEIPNRGNIPIGRLMLEKTRFENRSSFEYFWNLAELESEHYLSIVMTLSIDEDFESYTFFARFILPKFNEEQQTAFVAERGVDLLYCLCMKPERSEQVLNVWMYIKDKMDETNFIGLIESMVFNETRYTPEDPSVEKSEDDENHIECVRSYCEIWNSTASNFKRSASNKLLAEKRFSQEPRSYFPRPARRLFLQLVLEAVTSEVRNVFWSNNWKYLLCTTRVEDLRQIMKLCFVNADEISLFRKNTMVNYRNLFEVLRKFLDQGYFADLAAALDFICQDDVQTRRELKQQCLLMKFGNEDGYSLFNGFNICELKSMHEFIDDAYSDNANLAMDFRDQLLSLPDTESDLFEHIITCFEINDENADIIFRVKELVDSFASRGHNVEQLKERLVGRLKWHLIENQITDVEYFRDFLIWCLGSDNRVTEFELSLSPDHLLHAEAKMLENGMFSHEDEDLVLDGSSSIYPRTLDTFLSWYVDTLKKIKEFGTNLSDIFKMFIPPNVSFYFIFLFLLLAFYASPLSTYFYSPL